MVKLTFGMKEKPSNNEEIGIVNVLSNSLTLIVRNFFSQKLLRK